MKDLIKRAYEKYPENFSGFFAGEMIDSSSDARMAYMSGYQDAERDLELSWRDIDMILAASEEVKNAFCDDPKNTIGRWIEGEATPEKFKKAMLSEVLKRYREKKDENLL